MLKIDLIEKKISGSCSTGNIKKYGLIEASIREENE